MDNLLIAFPEKTPEERTVIAKQFYRNLIDTFIESIKMISLTKAQFLERCTGNFEVLDDIIKKGKNIQLLGAHQFNWEFGNWILPIKINLPVAAVYMPIKNKALNRLFLKVRGRFGTIMVDATNYSKNIKKVARQQHALGLVADQNPGWAGNAYWLYFFKRPAPFLIGPEKGAVRSNSAVVFTRYVTLKRGHYYFENHVITDGAAHYKPGELTVKFRDFIEEAIKREPAGFLWSHRRWKHEYKEEFGRLWIDSAPRPLPNSSQALP